MKMKSRMKTESIPLLDSDLHDLKDVSDYSSSSIHYSTDYGTYQNDGDKNFDNKNFIESVSDRYPTNPEERHLKRLNDFSDMKNVTISWAEINCYAPELGKGFLGTVKETGLFKQLLFDVSGVVHSGQLTAIMGASGAGKSTLLNIITCRNLGNLRIDGEVKVNGYSMHSNIKGVSAYVQQLDVFWGRLKVREHLIYNAVLRMGRKYTREQQIKRVDELVSEMGLGIVANEFINSPSYKVQGLAGSEKKLLSIACELLVDPPILFLDEPTTGLDAKMANKVVIILQSLAKKGKCILCTIHQPSSHIFELFNQVYLLAEGRWIFQGSRDQALDFFCDIGFPCAENYNPADHFIHTMAIRPDREADCRAKVIYMARKFKDTSEYGFFRKEILDINNTFNEQQTQDIPNVLKSISPFKATYWNEIKIQTWKQLLDQVRDPKLFAARYIQNFILVIILSIFYFQQKYDQVGVNNISGVLFNVITNVTFLAVVQLNSFVSGLKFYFRDHQNGMCRSGTFFIAQNFSEMPIFLSTTLTTVIFIYWCVGLYNGIAEFLMFTLVVLIIYQYSYSLNIMFIGTLFKSLEIILNIAPLVRIVMMYVGGYLINDATLPEYLNWLKYLSWHRYGFEILLVNQWQNVKVIKCENQNSCYNTGTDVIGFYHFAASNVIFDLLMLIGLSVFFRVCGLLFIIWRSKERKLN